MSKIDIILFVTAIEFDMFKSTIEQLNQQILDESFQYTLHVYLGSSDNIIQYNTDTYNPDSINKIFKDELVNLKSGYKTNFICDPNIIGCVSARRHAFDEIDTDFYIWLDPDIIFNEYILYYYTEILKLNPNDGYLVLTPEVVKLWDNTWNCIVNERYLDSKEDMRMIINPYEVSKFDETYVIEAERVVNTYEDQPKIKFGGGWFTGISKKTSMLTNGIPDTFGHYGLEDTWLMFIWDHLTPEPHQYKLKNMLICENYYDRRYSFEGDLELIRYPKNTKYHTSKKIFNEELKRVYYKHKYNIDYENNI